MWGRRIKSALFIDYENVRPVFSPDHIENLSRWFEDGAFDAGRKRKLVAKRVYCNSEAQRHEAAFRNHGFDFVLCEKFVPLKNGADIRISIDVVECIGRRWGLKEIILLTRDTDFLPLVEYLSSRRKVTVILVDEENERIFEIFSSRADIAIPSRALREAAAYERTVRLRDLRDAVARFKGRLLAMQRRRAAQPADPVMQAAVELVLDVTRRKPNQHTARADIEKALKRMPGFTTHGADAYLGLGSYRALMLELARRTGRIAVDDASGVSVRHLPDPGDT